MAANENAFLMRLKRKRNARSDVQEIIDKLRQLPASDILEMSGVLKDEDLLLLVQAKLPHALSMAHTLQSIPPGLPRVIRKALLQHYFADAVDESDLETFATLLGRFLGMANAIQPIHMEK